MLILSRKAGESILIGDDIEIIILETDTNQIKLGINAPKTVKVLRKEILQRVNQENIAASKPLLDLESLKTIKK